MLSVTVWLLHICERILIFKMEQYAFFSTWIKTFDQNVLRKIGKLLKVMVTNRHWSNCIYFLAIGYCATTQHILFLRHIGVFNALFCISGSCFSGSKLITVYQQKFILMRRNELNSTSTINWNWVSNMHEYF